MQTSLFTVTLGLSIVLAVPVTHADNAPAVTQYLRNQASVKYGNPAPRDSRKYYGTPEVGVKHLTKEARENLLQDLQQRVLNLQKSRLKPGLSPTYTTNQKIYERVLRRVGNAGLAHYRRQQDPTNRLIWDGTTLKEEKDLTPENIQEVIDAYNHVRSVRGSPEDHCKMYSGMRQATCRYEQRADERNFR